MRFPSPILTALSAAAVAALVAGCSNSAVAPSGKSSGLGSIHQTGVRHYAVISAIPKGFVPVRPSHSNFVAPNTTGNGEVYVSSFLATTINAYKIPDSGNHAPKCTDSPINSPNGINMGPNRTLWDPDGGTRTIIPFAKNCGGEGTPIASFNSNQPSDVAFNTAGTMYVANTTGGGADVYVGGVYSTSLTNAAFNGLDCFGVAVDKAGDVFVSSNSNVVVEFVGGAEPGVVLTSSGMTGTSAPLGMAFDKHQNLILIDINNGILVYAPPYTQAPSKTQAAHGSSAYGHLDKTNEFLYVSDFAVGSVDVYSYPGLHYKYSITNGLVQGNIVEGVAVDFIGDN
jgi:hypothetical protein